MRRITLLCALLIALVANGQWNTDLTQNTLVANSEPYSPQSIGMSDGKTYVVFWKLTSSTTWDLRVQVLDVNGNKQLGDDGSLVSSSIPMGSYTVQWFMQVDENDNLYVGATGTGSGTPAYLFKLDSTGNHLWPNTGVNLGGAFQVKPLPLSNNEVVVAYMSTSTEVSTLQKFDATGAAVWGSPVTTDSSLGNTAPGELFALNDGSFVSVFHKRLGSGTNSNLYAQRYDTNGVAQWTNAVQLSNHQTSYNRSYHGLADGDVVFMSYTGVHDNRFDTYVQRINSDGSLPWGINGMDFDVAESFFETDITIATDHTATSLWAISTYNNSAFSEYGEYVQKFDKVTGARQLTDNAHMVYAVTNDVIKHQGYLRLLNGTPLFLVEYGFDSGADTDPTTLSAVQLDGNGDFSWEDEDLQLATNPSNKSNIYLTEPINGQAVAVFVENKIHGANASRIYAQNFVDPASLSIGDIEQPNQTVFFTNPIVNTLEVNSSSPIISLKVYDILGKLVAERDSLNSNTVEIDASSWRSGIYLLNVQTQTGIIKAYKVIKQ